MPYNHRMRKIRHRVNTVEALLGGPRAVGAEVDVRSRGGELVLSHDAFGGGERLENYCEVWAREGFRGTLVLNVKEDGIENAVCQTVERWGIHDYFLVDLAIPAAV